MGVINELGRFRCWLCAGLNVTHVHKKTMIVSICRDCGALRRSKRKKADGEAY
jgi:hypothetical protein